MSDDDLSRRIGRIEGLLEGIDKRMTHADTSRHAIASAVQALALREAKRTWFLFGVAAAGGGAGGAIVPQLLQAWGVQ